MRVKDLLHWKWEKTPAPESIPSSDNSGSESKNDCETEIEDPEDDSTDEYPPLGM